MDFDGAWQNTEREADTSPRSKVIEKMQPVDSQRGAVTRRQTYRSIESGKQDSEQFVPEPQPVAVDAPAPEHSPALEKQEFDSSAVGYVRPTYVTGSTAQNIDYSPSTVNQRAYLETVYSVAASNAPPSSLPQGAVLNATRNTFRVEVYTEIGIQAQ